MVSTTDKSNTKLPPTNVGTRSLTEIAREQLYCSSALKQVTKQRNEINATRALALYLFSAHCHLYTVTGQQHVHCRYIAGGKSWLWGWALLNCFDFFSILLYPADMECLDCICNAGWVLRPPNTSGIVLAGVAQDGHTTHVLVYVFWMQWGTSEVSLELASAHLFKVQVGICSK